MKKHITKGQRYEISVLLQAGHGKSYIAEKLKVHESTIRREIKNNCDKRSGEYNPELAQRKSEARMSSRNHFTKMDDAMKEKIYLLLYEGWSPEQIHGRLKYEGVDIVSHETIYNHVHADTTGELVKHMPHELKYKKRTKKHRETKATNIANRTSIHNRPKEADGKRFGDWEMDLIVDSFNHAILTLVERSTNMLLMQRLPQGKKSKPLAKEVSRLLLPYRNTINTITTDNGPEFADHLTITKKIGAKVYFADPYSSWQKGCIENTNKLIRQYIPKKSIFNDFSDGFIKKVQKKINLRPREKLNFSAPKDEFFKHFL